MRQTSFQPGDVKPLAQTRERAPGITVIVTGDPHVDTVVRTVPVTASQYPTVSP